MRRRSSLAGAGRKPASSKSQLDAIGTPADSAVLHAAVAEAKARGTVEQSLSEGQTRLRTLKERIAAQVAGLPLWQGSLGRVDPGESAGREHRRAVRRPSSRNLTIRSNRAREKADEFRAQLSQLDAEIATLKGTSEIPTADAIAEARRRRDLGWNVVRRTFIDRDEPALTKDEAELFDSTHDLPGFYESSVRAADALVDRKEAEAQRVARYAELTSRREDTVRRLTSAAHEASSCERARAELQAAWNAAWRPAGLDSGNSARDGVVAGARGRHRPGRPSGARA